MRDLLLFVLFFFSIIYALKKPHIGLLIWSVFSYMNPHRLTWGAAYTFPFVYITAMVTIFSYLINKDKKPLRYTPLLAVWGLFILWVTLTTFNALEPEAAMEQYIKVLKIQVMTLVTLLLFQERERINQLVWVIFVSIGFYGLKGGVFTVLTGGGSRVWGPPGSFIEDNNELAIATLMVIPLSLYLFRETKNVWIKRGLIASIFIMIASVIGSQSRGALVSLLAVGVYFWLKSKNKLSIAVIILMFSIALASVIPEKWYERMETITTYEQDRSAMGRIDAWKLAINIANSHILGGGLNPWSKPTYAAYSPTYKLGDRAYAAHSIYFSILGEHGWIGLFLYLLVFILAWRNATSIMRKTKDSTENRWMYELSQVLKVSLIAYGSGGAFLSLSYFDLPWHLVSIIVLMASMLKVTNESKMENE